MIILNSVLFVIVVIVFLIIALVHLAPGAVTRFAINSERKRSGLVRKGVDLSNGLHSH